MTTETKTDLVPFENLLEPPINRAAYSDRTAWIMSVMSKLAYVRFEKATAVDAALADALKLITGKENPDEQENTQKIHAGFKPTDLLTVLKNVAGASERKTKRGELEKGLRDLNFTLLETFSVHIPLIADTQAFLAKLVVKGQDPFLVLSFRGTEPKKPTDLKSDLEAEPHILGTLGGPGGSVFIPEGDPLTLQQKTWPKVKVHPGFWKAFKAVEKDLTTTLNDEKYAKMPLYITGHSLGGALATVATYSLASDRIAACYTFGGPRVGNLQFGQRIKPPIYRIINASDIVPRVPPGIGIDILTVGLRAIPMVPYLDTIADFLERFRGYRHYGDMRHLSAANSATGGDADNPHIAYPSLIVRANPPQISRWYWLGRRWVATWGRAAVADHSIDQYMHKLAYWAYIRSL